MINKTRLFWGLVCLVLAGSLAVLNFTLPPEKLMFMIGDDNLPFLPPVILGFVGLALVVTATIRPKT